MSQDEFKLIQKVVHVETRKTEAQFEIVPGEEFFCHKAVKENGETVSLK